MNPDNKVILRSFCGTFFDVCVALYWKPPHHRVTVQVRTPYRSMACTRGGFNCSIEPLDELANLVESARKLVVHLDAGGALGAWDSEDCAMEEK